MRGKMEKGKVVEKRYGEEKREKGKDEGR